MLMVNRGFVPAANLNYRYGFNGKEKQDEFHNNSGDMYDFGARIYDPRVARFLSVDNFSSKFPGNSPYLFGGNSPIGGVDVGGDSLYILAYVSGNGKGDDLFQASALTRKYDIEHSGHFDPQRDKVAVLEVQDMSDIKVQVEKTTADFAATYGKTVEFGIWSHSGFDGPIGSKSTSENPKDFFQWDVNKGWGSVNFNWDPTGKDRAGFYGCNSGNTEPGSIDNEVSFTTKLSGLSNFKDVSVWGQTGGAVPSSFTNTRNISLLLALEDYMPVESKVATDAGPVNVVNKTYMVQGNLGGGQSAFFGGTPTLPMRVSKNGVGIVKSGQL